MRTDPVEIRRNKKRLEEEDEDKDRAAATYDFETI